MASPLPRPVSVAPLLVSWLRSSLHSAPLRLLVLCGFSLHCVPNVRPLAFPWFMPWPLRLRSGEEEQYLKISRPSLWSPYVLCSLSSACLAWGLLGAC